MITTGIVAFGAMLLYNDCWAEFIEHVLEECGELYQKHNADSVCVRTGHTSNIIGTTSAEAINMTINTRKTFRAQAELAIDTRLNSPRLVNFCILRS